MATLEQLHTALTNAHNAGDIAAARQLADEIVRMQQTAAPTETQQTTQPQDYQRKPATWGEVLLGAAPRAAAGLTDVVLNTPENLMNLGKMAYGTAVTAAGRPDLAPDVTAPASRVTTAAQQANLPGFMAGEELTPAQRIVDVGLQGAVLAPVGGTSNILRNMALGGISGATGQATTEATGSPMAGIAASIATPAVLGSLQRSATVAATRGAQAQAEDIALKQAQNAIRDKVWKESHDAGFVAPKSAVAPTTITSIAEKAVGEPALTQKAQIKNQDTINNLVRKEFGIDAKTPLSEDLFEGLRKEAGQAYADIQNLPLQQVQVLNPNTGLMQARQLNPKQLVTDWKKANDDYRDFTKQANIAGNTEAREKAQIASARMNQLQAEIDQAVSASGKPELLTKLRDAKVQISKLHAVEDSFNSVSQNIDGAILKRIEDKYANRGVNFTGNLKTITNFVRGFPNYVKETSKMRSPGGDVYDVSLPVLANVLNAPVAGIMGAARAPIRNLMLSDVYQNALVKPNYSSNSLLTGAQQTLNQIPSIPNIYTPSTLAVGQNALINRGQQ